MVIFSGKSSIHGSFSIARVITGGYPDGFGPCLRVIFLGLNFRMAIATRLAYVTGSW